MARGQVVVSPDGDRWQVRRRWLNRPLPKLRRVWREDRNEDGALGIALEGGLDVLGTGGAESIPLAIAAGVGVALLVFFLLPLIGVAIEFAVVLALLSSGIVGRLLLRRPWAIEAVNAEHPERSATFAVKGWRRSRRVMKELRETIQTSGLPQQLSGAEQEI